MSDQKNRAALAAISPRKRPSQERSREMVRRILDSAQQVIREKGFAGLTTIAIAQQAGLSVGSLYQYFPNKEAVVLDLARRWLAEVQSVLGDLAAAPVPSGWAELEDGLRRFHRNLSGVYRDNAQLIPIMEAMSASPDLARIDGEHNARVVDTVADWLMRVDAGLAGATARRLANMMLYTGDACFASVLAAGGDLEIASADLMIMLMALLRAHLSLSR